MGEFKNTAPKAYRVLMLLGGSDGIDYHGRNMKAFLVGRQFFVACMMVLLGKVTGYAGAKGVLVTGDDWGMGAGFNEWSCRPVSWAPSLSSTWPSSPRKSQPRSSRSGSSTTPSCGS